VTGGSRPQGPPAARQRPGLPIPHAAKGPCIAGFVQESLEASALDDDRPEPFRFFAVHVAVDEHHELATGPHAEYPLLLSEGQTKPSSRPGFRVHLHGDSPGRRPPGVFPRITGSMSVSSPARFAGQDPGVVAVCRRSAGRLVFRSDGIRGHRLSKPPQGLGWRPRASRGWRGHRQGLFQRQGPTDPTPSSGCPHL
jgi:hypothetical protein